jgi:hypothetical protein
MILTLVFNYKEILPHESASVRQENLRQVQGHPSFWPYSGHLRKPQTQATPRIILNFYFLPFLITRRCTQIQCRVNLFQEFLGL